MGKCCSVRFFIVRPNRVGNQFYDDKPNGSCYMDWNENFSPAASLSYQVGTDNMHMGIHTF